MKKSFKTILSIATLSITGLMVGGIALSSCGSNTSVQNPQGPENNENQQGQGSGTGGGASGSQGGASGTGGNIGTGGSQGSGGGNTQDPPQIEVPSLPENVNPFQKYILNPSEGARVILNKDENANDPNNDIADSNVKKLLDFCGISTNIDPLGYNGYFADALIFTGTKTQDDNATVSVKEDEKLKDHIGFYLYQGDLNTNSEDHVLDLAKLIASKDDWKDLTSTTKDISLKGTTTINDNLHIAVYFKKIDDINKNNNKNKQRLELLTNSKNNLEFVEETLNKSKSTTESVADPAPSPTITTDNIDKNLFIFKLTQLEAESEAINIATKELETQTSNSIELVLQKTIPMTKDEGWKSIDSLPIVYPGQTMKIETKTELTTNQIAHAYVYSVDETQVTGKDSDKYFKLEDGKVKPGSDGQLIGTNFRTHLPNKTNQSEINLYLLYTNGENIDINQFNLKPGCKFILINNNPNKISKIKTSSLFNPKYGSGELRGPIFNLGSTFGWYGKFEFENSWKSFITNNINKACYIPISQQALTIEFNKNI